ncbi:hypothetical protein IWQ57_000634, partial [Coemansia nantahalensis]
MEIHDVASHSVAADIASVKESIVSSSTSTTGSPCDSVAESNNSRPSRAPKHSVHEIAELGAEEAFARSIAPSITSSGQGFAKDTMPRLQTHIIVAGLCLLYFISALDMTILATVYIDIANKYQSLPSGIWIITSYLLANTAVQPLFGKFSDVLGRMEAVGVSCVLFCVGSVICAAANSMTMLVAGRAVQGIGGGGLMAMPSVILGDVVSERDRGKFTSFLAG